MCGRTPRAAPAPLAEGEVGESPGRWRPGLLLNARQQKFKVSLAQPPEIAEPFLDQNIAF